QGFVVGGHTELYLKLGCADQPRSTDVIANVAAMSARGEAPSRPDLVYPALVRALRKERVATDQFAERPIIWAHGAYVAPADVLAGRLVLNDHPALADAAMDQGVRIAFPDRDEPSQDFFRTLGLRSLTEVSASSEARVGAVTRPPTFLREEDLIDRIHSVDF